MKPVRDFKEGDWGWKNSNSGAEKWKTTEGMVRRGRGATGHHHVQNGQCSPNERMTEQGDAWKAQAPGTVGAGC